MVAEEPTRKKRKTSGTADDHTTEFTKKQQETSSSSSVVMISREDTTFDGWLENRKLQWKVRRLSLPVDSYSEMTVMSRDDTTFNGWHENRKMLWKLNWKSCSLAKLHRLRKKRLHDEKNDFLMLQEAASASSVVVVAREDTTFDGWLESRKKQWRLCRLKRKFMQEKGETLEEAASSSSVVVVIPREDTTFDGWLESRKKLWKLQRKRKRKLRSRKRKLLHEEGETLSEEALKRVKRKHNARIPSSGFFGVYKSGENFKAKIRMDGKSGKAQHVGTYNTAKDAAVAWDRAALRNGQLSSELHFPLMIHNLNDDEEEPKKSNRQGKKKKTSKRKREEIEEGLKNEVKYQGVQKKWKRFYAKISIDGKTQYLGSFATSKEAAEAYDRAAMQAGRPSSKLNFPDKILRGCQIWEKTTDFTGVYQNGKKFTARINIHGEIRDLGIFDYARYAAIAFDTAILNLGMNVSRCNYPNGIAEDEEGAWF